MNYPKWRLLSKTVLAGIFLLWLGMPVQACEICGCGAGNLYFGLLPNAERHSLALRYRQIGFTSHLYPNDPYADLFKTQERFEIVELMGRFQLGNRWNLGFFLPYAFARQVRTERSFYHQGLADALIQTQYTAWNSDWSSPAADWKHELRMGAAVKAPIGKWKYATESAGDVENPNFQPGTGSWDAMATLQYVLKYKGFGLQTDAQYRINGTNSNGYRFGNRTTGNIHFLYVQQWEGKKSLVPFAGVYGETSQANRHDSRKVSKTGGQLWMWNLGAQVHYQSFSLMLQWQTPLKQSLSQGHIKAENRSLVQLGYAF